MVRSSHYYHAKEGLAELHRAHSYTLDKDHYGLDQNELRALAITARAHEAVYALFHLVDCLAGSIIPASIPEDVSWVRDPNGELSSVIRAALPMERDVNRRKWIQLLADVADMVEVAMNHDLPFPDLEPSD